MYECGCLHVMIWNPIWGVFLPHAHCTQDGLWIPMTQDSSGYQTGVSMWTEHVRLKEKQSHHS